MPVMPKIAWALTAEVRAGSLPTLETCCWGLSEEKAFALVGEPPELVAVLITGCWFLSSAAPRLLPQMRGLALGPCALQLIRSWTAFILQVQGGICSVFTT